MERKELNILQVTDYLAPYEGNFICSIKNLESHVINQGGNMFFLFPKEAYKIKWIKELENKREGKVFYLGKSVIENIKIIKKLIKKNNINIVHSHFCLPITQLAVKISCVTSPNVSLVQHYHNHYQIPENKLKRPIFKYIFSGDLNIGCSESVSKSIIYNEKKIVTATNAIYFPRLNNYTKIERKELGIEEESIVILMFGFDYLRKGVDIAIKAINNIAKKYNITLLISISVGMDEISKKIKDEFGDIPSWLKLVLSRNDIGAYYNISDIFLSAAREEGFCYAMVEAIYCNLICVSSKIDGPPLNIPGVKTFKNGDWEDLSQKLEEIILLSEEQKLEIKKVAKDYVEKEYDIDSWSLKIIDEYKRLI